MSSVYRDQVLIPGTCRHPRRRRSASRPPPSPGGTRRLAGLMNAAAQPPKMGAFDHPEKVAHGAQSDTANSAPANRAAHAVAFLTLNARDMGSRSVSQPQSATDLRLGRTWTKWEQPRSLRGDGAEDVDAGGADGRHDGGEDTEHARAHRIDDEVAAWDRDGVDAEAAQRARHHDAENCPCLLYTS